MGLACNADELSVFTNAATLVYAPGGRSPVRETVGVPSGPAVAELEWNGERVVATTTEVRVGSERLEGAGEFVLCQSLSPDARFLATGSREGWIRMRRLLDGFPGAAWRAHEAGIDCLEYSPDGRTIASACEDGSIGIWDCKSGASVATLRGHEGPLTALTFSPRGEWLASGARDGQVQLWAVASQQLLTTLPGMGAVPTDVRLASSLEQASVLYDNGTALVWDLTRFTI